MTIYTILFQSGKYVAINTIDPTTLGYYVVKCVSDAYNLKEDTTCDGKIITFS